jgi:hypothetical protein
VALCQARISTKPLWGFSSSNPYHSQSRAEHPPLFRNGTTNNKRERKGEGKDVEAEFSYV